MIGHCSEYLFTQCKWMYDLIMSGTRFRANPYSTVAWMSRNSLIKAGVNLKFKWVQLDSNPEPLSCYSQATIECGFTLKHVGDVIGTYIQLHCPNKCSEQSWIVWWAWPNSWVCVYQLSGSGFDFSWNHLNFRLRACFEQGVPSYSSNYGVWIHSETLTWQDKNLHSI